MNKKNTHYVGFRTLEYVANLFEVNEKTILNEYRERGLEGCKIGKRVWYTDKELNEFMQKIAKPRSKNEASAGNSSLHKNKRNHE